MKFYRLTALILALIFCAMPFSGCSGDGEVDESTSDFIQTEGEETTPEIDPADKFVADEKIKEDLAKRYGASICEMECAGVLLPGRSRQTPRG